MCLSTGTSFYLNTALNDCYSENEPEELQVLSCYINDPTALDNQVWQAVQNSMFFMLSLFVGYILVMLLCMENNKEY